MKRKVSLDRRYKKSVWTTNQRLEAVSTYLMLGSMTETAIVTGIPLPTLKTWRYLEWFKEYALQLQSEDVQQMDSNLRRVVDKSLKAVEDRLDLGDAQFNQKTGKITRIPVKAHVALKITTELLSKREKNKESPMKEHLEKTIDDRLLKLSEEFARFANTNKKVSKELLDVDVVATEVTTSVN